VIEEGGGSGNASRGRYASSRGRQGALRGQPHELRRGIERTTDPAGPVKAASTSVRRPPRTRVPARGHRLDLPAAHKRIDLAALLNREDAPTGVGGQRIEQPPESVDMTNLPVEGLSCG